MSDDTSLFPSEITDLDGTKKNSKKIGGRALFEVWNFFLKGLEIKNNKGHYSAKCNYCLKYFEVGYPSTLEKHLARECVQCDQDIREYYLDLIMGKMRKIMLKIHSYYLSNTEKELKYVSQN